MERHPFLRANAHRWQEERSWRAGDGDAELVLVRRPNRNGAARVQLVGVGAPEDLAGLLADAAPSVGADTGFGLLTRGTWDRVDAAVRRRYGFEAGPGWDWMWTADVPPASPGEDQVAPVTGPGAEAAVRECLARSYPDAHADPADPRLTWWGYRDEEGALRGVVAVDAAPGQGAHLSGLGTDEAWRRRGVATAMAAAVTRHALGQHPFVHFGIWADNDAARRVYARLGYRVGHLVENVRPVG